MMVMIVMMAGANAMRDGCSVLYARKVAINGAGTMFQGSGNHGKAPAAIARR
jgi:hypothetical protein